MDKHTPTPWYSHAEGSVRICDGAHESVHGCRTIAEAEIFDKGRPLAYANASLIVRAVNSHDALMASAELALQYINKYSPSAVIEGALNSALKLAKGE